MTRVWLSASVVDEDKGCGNPECGDCYAQSPEEAAEVLERLERRMIAEFFRRWKYPAYVPAPEYLDQVGRCIQRAADLLDPEGSLKWKVRNLRPDSPAEMT